jgi:hypothetical protein
MKRELVFGTTLLAIMLLSAACVAQGGTSEPGPVTAEPTLSGVGSAATDEAGETAMIPTLSADGGAPAQEAGGTAAIPQAGLPDDLDDMIQVLSESGATLELGDEVQQAGLAVSGQILRINGEEVQIFTFSSAEEMEVQASQLADDGNSEDETDYYKLGSMLVYYAGTDTTVRDLLEDVLGARAAGE